MLQKDFSKAGMEKLFFSFLFFSHFLLFVFDFVRLLSTKIMDGTKSQKLKTSHLLRIDEHDFTMRPAFAGKLHQRLSLTKKVSAVVLETKPKNLWRFSQDFVFFILSSFLFLWFCVLSHCSVFILLRFSGPSTSSSTCQVHFYLLPVSPVAAAATSLISHSPFSSSSSLRSPLTPHLVPLVCPQCFLVFDLQVFCLVKKL